MPLPGGASNKLGIYYEGLWTIHCMIDVIDETADSIYLEPPGEQGKGFEFILRKGDTFEYHQVKRQNAALGRWSISALASEGVLSHFLMKLKNPKARCVFISTQDADELSELVERAEDAGTPEVFLEEFLNSQNASAHFEKLRSNWNNCTSEMAYEYLERIQVEPIGESFLCSTVENRIKTLIEGEPASIADVLSQLALKEVHHELTAHDIWLYLEGRGYRRRRWENDPHVLAAVKAANNRYLTQLRERAIGGKVIPREKVQTILNLLTSAPERNKRGVMVTGVGGVGKSGVILQVVESLQERGWSISTFRIDRLEPKISPDDVGRQLGLPGSPANVLGAISKGRDSLLVIDQLDAVSQASGRNPQFFDCVNEILNQAQIHQRMRLLLACRYFDLNNDHRLRSLTGKKGVLDPVNIEHLLLASVKKVIRELGIDVERLTARQLEILSIPSHLKLLEEIAEGAGCDVLNFNTTTDLYNLLWDRKQAVIRERIGHSVQWAAVLYIICDYMSDHQVLSVPESIVDKYSMDAKIMASEHILVLDGERYAFFHEGFFDYAFARLFAASGKDLVTFLKSDEQHLFRRAQVRQILLHERDMDRDRYLANIKALLRSPEIRYHIKQVVFAFLTGLITDPTEEEWSIIAELCIDSEHFNIQDVWRGLSSSMPWFRLLDSLGIVKKWLAGRDEKCIDRAIMLLSGAQREIPERVIDLVAPYISASETWQDRILYLLRGAELDKMRCFSDLFLRLVDEGAFDKANDNKSPNRDIWSFLYSLAEKNPEWTCEAIGRYFNHSLDLSIACSQPNPFDDDHRTVPKSQVAGKILKKSASGASLAFVRNVLPFMLKVIELNSKKEGDPPWRDTVWESRFFDEDIYISDIERAILFTMEAAFSDLAAKFPEDFLDISGQLYDSDYETVQYLLVRGYTANGKFFADIAADYLTCKSSRLKTGWAISSGGNTSHWATRKLLEAITPHCADDRLEQLEKIILDYYTDWGKRIEGDKDLGYAQFVLLEGIVFSRLSNQAKRSLGELHRKFDVWSIKPPKRMRSLLQPAASPITQEKAERMKNDHWLKAIARYYANDLWEKRDGKNVGGAVELSWVLEKQVKKEPYRFAGLALEFPNDTNPYYFDAVLSGISEADLAVETVFRVCKRCHELPNRPCGLSICRTIEKYAKLPLPEEMLDIVAWYATEDPDPEEELWQSKSTSGERKYDRDILNATINSVRGIAAKSIGALIFYDGNRINYFLPTLERMVNDSSIAVKAGVAEALTFVFRHNADLALRLFHRLCETEDILLSTYYVERFINYALESHFDNLRPIMERMIKSIESEVAIAGARQACVAALFLENARLLVRLCLSGSDPQKTGAAQVFSTNFRKTDFRSFCEESLIKLFDDPSEEVCSIAASCFGDLGEELTDYINLIEPFIQSRSFTIKPDTLIFALAETTAKLPDIACLVCERFLDVAGLEVGDIRTHSAFLADTVSKLIVRIYSQTKEKTIHKRCLDLIDRLTYLGGYGLDNVLSIYER